MGTASGRATGAGWRGQLQTGWHTRSGVRHPAADPSLALLEAALGIATPELQEMLMQTVYLLAAVQARLVAIMPVTVHLQ